MSTWTTSDGRVLQIKWMDSAHLVNTVNMVIRQNGVTKKSVGGASGQPGTVGGTVAAMRDELKARALYEWHDNKLDYGGTLYDQLVVPSPREDFQTMCLQRAMIDTGLFAPSIVEWHHALHALRNSFETTWLGIEQALAAPYGEAEKRDLERIVAKFAEYRLAPPEQWR